MPGSIGNTPFTKPFCLCVLVSLLIIGDTDGQSADIRHIGINNGLSNNSVRSIFQDHNGFLWFGTYDGLNRYDGYNFKVFRNKINDTASLPHNYINAIGEDHHGNIFVGTGQGLSIYNNRTSKFLTGTYTPAGSMHREPLRFNVSTIKTDARGNVFLVTTGGGLLVVPDGADAAIQVACTADAPGNCKADVQSLLIDQKQRIWLVIADAGLFRYDPVTQKLTLVDARIKSGHCMEIDDAENLWIGAFDGLYQYHIPSGSLVRPYDERPGQLSSNSIFCLAFDRQKQLWIGTEGGGINVIDPATKKINRLLPGDGKNRLSSETVNVIYEDKERRIWIGTYKGGIDIIDPQKGKFRTIGRDPLHSNSLVSNFISSFYDDQNGNLWVGSDGGGVSCWNRKDNSFTNYMHQPGDKKTLSHNAVPGILQDYLGNIWMATYGGGINKFDKRTGTYQHYKCVDEQTGEEHKYVWRLFEDRDRNLWATTYIRGKLYRLNRQKDRFEVFCPEMADLFCLMQDRTGALWAGSVYGVSKVDQQNRTYISYPITKPVRAVVEDREGRIWLGTEGLGLVLFDQEKGRVIKSFSDADGLCSNAVLNILEDGEGHLWLSTFNGLAEFDPVKQSFRNFFVGDGLQSNQFSYNAGLRLRSGEMVFGGIGGFTLFHPDSLKQLSSPLTPIYLSSILVNNEPATPGTTYASAINNEWVSALTVPFDQAFFSFSFSSIDFSGLAGVNYAYYLEGWDKSWAFTNVAGKANYPHLREGTYRLHAKRNTAGDGWGPDTVLVTIKVLPPWYRTWWAYLLYGCSIAGLIYLYNRYRVRQAKLKYEVKIAHLESEKEKELAQLEIQKEKELNEKKLAFFTDVSHEFRTPLTLIINPLRDYIQHEKLPQNSQELNRVYRNARRLLVLVDQLLQFRKAGDETDSLRIVKLDFCELCREVFDSFESLAKLKHLTYTFCSGDTPVELYADREKMEVILYNLLSNAVKFTPDGGLVSMSLTENDNTVEVKLSDNGSGIPPEAGNKLFERFYRVREGHSASQPGFGIGLYLVKQLVDKHKGRIVYESTPGAGTTFWASFQKGRKHFSGLPIYEEEGERAPKPEVVAEAESAPEPGKTGLEDWVSDQKTILVVEDNEQIREYIGSIFRGDFTVYQAASGNEGTEMARKYLPDIIISDIMMDQGTGIELCSAIKNDPSLGHIPVILLTAVSDNEIRLKGTESGADDYITKPFDNNLLIARVKALLKQRNKVQEYFYNEVTHRQQDFKISAEYKEFLETCIGIVERHLEDETFTIKKLAQEMGMSHSALYRKVKSVSGQSIAGFIRFIRLRKAAELMIKSDGNVSEIVFQVGINDIKHFRKQFTALFGMTPSEYIKKFRPAFTQTFTVHQDLKKYRSNGSGADLPE